ncbi:MAG TPA: alkylmercury lyase [Cryptosporangiaceae bacterium]|nr:alkylmercury lyase [Cryptosporangiaceae bacterium]
MRIELLFTPDCPHVGEARAVLRECLDELGLDVPVLERVGDHLSPTLLVDGLDVTGRAGAAGVPACRVEPPKRASVLAALRRRGLDWAEEPEPG